GSADTKSPRCGLFPLATSSSPVASRAIADAMSKPAPRICSAVALRRVTGQFGQQLAARSQRGDRIECGGGEFAQPRARGVEAEDRGEGGLVGGGILASGLAD